MTVTTDGSSSFTADTTGSVPGLGFANGVARGSAPAVATAAGEPAAGPWGPR